MKTPAWSRLHEEDESGSGSSWALGRSGPSASVQVQAKGEYGTGGQLDRLAGQAGFRPMANEDRKKVFESFLEIKLFQFKFKFKLRTIPIRVIKYNNIYQYKRNYAVA
jgi:hypothetical protein